jgi:predicted transcriptional regulator
VQTKRGARARDVPSKKVDYSICSAALRHLNFLVYGFEDQELEEVQALMEQKQIRRLPVLSRDKALVKIVALADLATKVGAAQAGYATQAISSSG